MSQYTESREPGYTAADLEVLYSKSAPSGWGQAIHWLQAEGMDETSLAPEHVHHMIEDLKCLDREEVTFTSDVQDAFAMAMEH